MITIEELNAWQAKLQAVNAENYAEIEAKIPGYFGGIEYTVGKKNAKFVITTGGSRSVVCFVDMETGAVLKPASFAAPAKGVRGYIETMVPGPVGSHWLYR